VPCDDPEFTFGRETLRRSIACVHRDKNAANNARASFARAAFVVCAPTILPCVARLASIVLVTGVRPATTPTATDGLLLATHEIEERLRAGHGGGKITNQGGPHERSAVPDR
jgi:hypothetical protein